jgi:hypothetical protein
MIISVTEKRQGPALNTALSINRRDGSLVSKFALLSKCSFITLFDELSPVFLVRSYKYIYIYICMYNVWQCPNMLAKHASVICTCGWKTQEEEVLEH